MSDRELVVEAQTGSTEAFNQLVQRHRATIVRFAARLTKNGDEAEDVAQETFIRAFRNLDTYRPTGAILSWLFAIARNVALDELRRAERHERKMAQVEDLLVALPGPEEHAISTDRAERLWSEIHQLAPRTATTLRLHYCDGLHCGEIAAALDIPLGTVKTDIWRARRLLRRRLPENGITSAA
ncbi:MAG TPA: sigma-70 family RNA polymerase sigma factor [Candidatus Baltobacteraceae bacterium]|jgi:RNA polymerase sigma-70 factor (ECF subfamily)|nr:sigma-70 family RNA polymerase sigma factor [Candidatus Baltobacteraceae bacterium]